MSEADLALMFFAARVLNALSHLGAAWLARRIGLLNTMVWTHLPSSLFLIAAPASPNAALAAALFLARESLVEMDVPTRQSYVMAVVKPTERTFASGVTNVTRNVAWAVGPSFAGVVMQHVALAGPLVIGGALKIVYDVWLFRAFRHVRPPVEELAAAAAEPRPRGPRVEISRRRRLRPPFRRRLISSSSHADRKTIETSASSRRTCAATSRPLMSGNDTSRTTTSGLKVRTASRAARPFSAVPMISHAGERSADTRLRINAWSSTRRMRGRSPGCSSTGIRRAS
jgi:MFS family permease